MFRPVLEERLQTQERKSNAGRRPIDPVLMLKVMFVQRLYGLSDEQAEYQIKDRTSFNNQAFTHPPKKRRNYLKYSQKFC
jgi:hypothetical protein